MRTKGRTHLVYERSTGLYFKNVTGVPRPVARDWKNADLYHPMDLHEIGVSYYKDSFQPILISSTEATATEYRKILGRIGGTGMSEKKRQALIRNGNTPKRWFKPTMKG